MMQKYDFSVIRSLRRRLSLTLHKLAEEAGLTYTTVENIEKNKAFPSLKTLDALAGALQVSASDMLAICEKHIVQRRVAKPISTDEPSNSEVGLKNCLLASYDKAKVIRVYAEKGDKVKSLRLHEDCFEICFCLAGCLELCIEENVHRLGQNETLLFDGMLEHSYTQIEDGQYITVHIPKSSNVLKAMVHSRD